MFLRLLSELTSGAKGGTRTPTPITGLDPKSSASTNSATFARYRSRSEPQCRVDILEYGEPPGTRTPNPQIKSLLLCQLS